MSVREALAPYMELVRQIAPEYGLEPELVGAICYKESHTDDWRTVKPTAHNRESLATGLMQVVPREAARGNTSHWAWTRPTIQELCDPATNIEWGCKILQWFIQVEKDERKGVWRFSGGTGWNARGGMVAFETKYWQPVQGWREELKQVDSSTVEQVFAVAKQHQLLAPNAQAGLWRAITARGYVPLSNEYRDGEWVCQLAANAEGDERVFRWQSGMRVGEAFPPLEEPAPKGGEGGILPLSHLAQGDLFPDADLNPGDCGPACFAMWAQSKGKYFTVDEFASALSKATGRPMPYDSTLPSDLEALGRWYGLVARRVDSVVPDQVRAEIAAGFPVIALVHAGSLPRTYSYSGGHYVLIVGMVGSNVVYHDPNEERNGRGSFVRLPVEAFWKAWRDAGLDGNKPCTGVFLR